jgi:hypothetical protein
MIRARIWFRCAAVFDPVSPVQVSPATLGWEARTRKVDLVIERSFSGEELLKRMKGWITVDPAAVIEVVKQHGRLKVLDDRVLVVEVENRSAYESLKQSLTERFPDKVDLEALTPLD